MTDQALATSLVGDYTHQVQSRLDKIAAMAAAGGLDAAITLMTDAIAAGGVIQAFGTGHSEAFAMEIAGRAGGLIPSTKIALRDVVLRGHRTAGDSSGSELERDPNIAQELWDVSTVQPEDLFMIASNSGVNGSIIGLAQLVKAHGHPLIAVTSMEHTMAVTPKHPSGQRLSDIADVVIDNLAPYGDATIELGPARDGAAGVPVGAVSSLTAAFIAQLLTIGVAEQLSARGQVPPLYLSANIPGGDEHNHVLEAQYEGRLRRGV